MNLTDANTLKPGSLLPIAETVDCIYKYPDGADCRRAAKKDGLCGTHWRKLYGHPYGKTLKTCPLCGESDPQKLGDVYSQCATKVENPDWENFLEEIKANKRDELAKERLALRLEQIEGKPRCTKILSGGHRCVREENKDGLCFNCQFRESLQNTANNKIKP